MKFSKNKMIRFKKKIMHLNIKIGKVLVKLGQSNEHRFLSSEIEGWTLVSLADCEIPFRTEGNRILFYSGGK